MKNARLLLMLAMMVSAAGLAYETEEERKAKQAELDAACEAARQVEIIAARAQLVEECVEKKQRPDRESCERFYATYGQNSPNGPALFFDLPACVTAHEYSRSYR